MNLEISKIILLATFITIISCEKNEKSNINGPQPIDTLDILDVTDFLFNIPISNDTILYDKDYNIDFRVEIEGYLIDSVLLIINNHRRIKKDTSIISSKNLRIEKGSHSILFLIRSVNFENGDTIYFKSNQLTLHIVENLSNRFVISSIDNGRLKITWPELDKKNTSNYLIERFMGEDMEYSHEFEVQDSIYFDNYYVGEEANFRISVINNVGNKQNIWYYTKPHEQPLLNVSQNNVEGYNIHYSKNKYFNNFGQYYLTTASNNNPEFLFSSTSIEDTSYHISDAKFAEEARFWLRYLPKEYPEGVSEEDWLIYRKLLYTQYGINSFKYNSLAIINNENLAYTSDGNIFKFNINANKITDSIINENSRYGLLKTTPAGSYVYAIDENINGTPLFFWSSNSFSTNPDYEFQIKRTIPPVSDNLLAIKAVPSSTSSTKLAIYDITNSNRIYTTDYNAYSSLRRISSDGKYYLTDQHELKLFSYMDNSLNLIYRENEWPKYYKFFDFNPLDNGICYIWDNDNVFSIRNTSDFSEINSFSIELLKIIYIDYYSKKIMGYVRYKLQIYNLDNGSLEKEIPTDTDELFSIGNKAILFKNTVYGTHGIKYIIE